MNRLLVLAVLVAAAHSLALDSDVSAIWKKYKETYGKQYFAFAEEMRRKAIFTENLNKIVHHNVEADLGLHSFRRGLNRFTDMTAEEFTKGYKGLAPGYEAMRTPSIHKPSVNAIPASWDWRTKGDVVPVKDQGGCGSCWAFSTVSAIEGQWAQSPFGGGLVSLSEQNLVDCVKDNAGCGGGWPDRAFRYVINNTGIDSEANYPYKGVDGKCNYTAAGLGAFIGTFVGISGGDEDALADAVANVGPVSICLDASDWQTYQSGIFDDTKCSRTSLDHAVLAVGYGTENGKDFWIVKNSWAETWGEKGYIRLARNKDNQCGVATLAMYPIVN